MGQAVVHFQIGVADDLAAAKFYTELFGWIATPVPGMPYHSIETGAGQGIPGGIAKAGNESEAVVTIYVEVDDVAESLAKASGMGATVTMAAGEVMPGLVLGMFNDPQGRSIGLVHDTRPRPAAAADAKKKTGASAKAEKKVRAGKGKDKKPKKDKKGKKGKKKR
ncbi:MAG TPA: VOC family protein [bacterium]|jgi:predicted enzyme related to lactoylglutathione lyase|nr:VOC family protein [bacterium]